jgi:hypothetical protein
MSDLLVLVPTRSRPHNVQKVVRAWWETGSFGTADLYFIVDADDGDFASYQQEITRLEGANMIILPEWKPLVPKLNRVAPEFIDQYRAIAFMGDDHLPRTPMWANHLVIGHSFGSSARIIYGRDGLQDQKLPTWWSMDSRIIRALGKMVPSDVQHLYCDNAIKELGLRSGTLHYDERILVEHMHPFAGKGEMDSQYERVNRHAQYASDQALFTAWLAEGADRDATLVQSIGG